MAGHNKWSKVKHKKAVTDAKKSKEFSRFAHLIATEVKNAGGDADAANVRAVVEKARAANMPNENINRAVTRGKGGGAGETEFVTYESYGPGGVALIIEGLTDNRNRTAAEVKAVLSKFDLTLAEQGAAAWAFEKTESGYEPQTTMELSEEDGEKLEKITTALMELDDVQEVYTNAAPGA